MVLSKVKDSIASQCRRKDDRPKEILTAALEEFSMNGFAGTRMDDVARRAGISKGTVYLYFKSKEELFTEVVRDRILPHIEQLENMNEQSEGSAKDVLHNQLKTIYQELLSTDARFIPKLIISEGSRFPELARFYFEEIITRIHKVTRAVIERGVASGEFRPSALTWEQQAILGPALSAVIWKTVFDQFAPLELDAYLETHIDLLLHGLLIKDNLE
ncbi:MAG: TetR/AcrR family transcriptional regulator [Gammaproteobacteria bacterium]|nr:MAG: TetR/AcrR family transcriptional regulator [Gammaproteobacteria bacterium]